MTVARPVPRPRPRRVAHGPWIHAYIDTLNTNRTYCTVILYILPAPVPYSSVVL